MFRKLLVSLVVMLGLSGSSANATHPVLHLTDGKQDSLRYSYTYNYNDTYIDNLYEWCFLNCSSYNSARLQDENYVTATLSTTLRNFALAYAIYPYAGNSQLYGLKAAELVNDLVMDPPGSFTSLADWMHKTHYYSARNVLYSYACVYDWTYNLMTPQQQYNVRRALVVTAERFYHDAHESEEFALVDSAYGSNRAHSNYNYGELLGYLAAVIAVKDDTATVVDGIYTYLVDTMLVENRKALRGGSFIALYRNYGNLVGRDVGGMHMESTKYSAEDNEMLGLIVDMYSKYEDKTVSELVTDYFSNAIMSQIYSTYPDRTFSGESKMFGEGYGGDGTIGESEAMAMIIASNLCSNADTAGAAIWWINNYSRLAPNDPEKLAFLVLFDPSKITPVSDMVPATSRYLSGPQYLFVQNKSTLSEVSDNMLLTFRGGVGCESTAQPGFGNITWFKGGFGVADPALIKTDANQYYINDFYHNTVSVDTCADGYKSWGAKLTGTSTLEHSSASSAYIYYAFDFTTPYTGQEQYVCNTVKHKEREFLYVPEDTLLFLFDRVSTYNTRRDPDSFTTVPHIYPITWNMYTEGSVYSGNTNFTVVPRYGPFKLAGFIANPDTSLYLMSSSSEQLLEVTESNCAVPYTSVLRYRSWTPDSTMLFASALWMNTNATSDSLFRVLTPHGNMFGIAKSATPSDTVWIDYVAMFSTDNEGDTGSVWGSGDSITISYGRPSDSVNVFLLNMASKVDSFNYKVAVHRADTLILRVRRTIAAGYTRCYSNTAGVVVIASGSTGGSLPPDPPPPDPPIGGKDREDPREFILPLLVLPFFRRKLRKALMGLGVLAVVLGLSIGMAYGQSGMKFDCTNASGTKYFIDINGNNFFASTLWVGLDADASGPLTIYRKTLASAQIDSTNAIIIQPGEDISLPAMWVRSFYYTKTAAADCMRYLPLIEGEMSYGGTPYEAPSPPAVALAEQDMFAGIEMIAGASSATLFNAGKRTYPATGGFPIQGAKRIALDFSWTTWTEGGFAFQPIYSSTSSDTGVVCLVAPVTSLAWVDSISVDENVSATFAPTAASGSARVILNVEPGIGYLFIRVWPHGKTTVHIHGLACKARRID